MKKITLLLSCWSLAYFSSGNPVFAQDFVDEEERIDFDRENSEEDFYPVEPVFEDSGTQDRFSAPENQVEIVEPAPNEPEPLRPRRESPPFQFGNGSRSLSRPSSGSTGSFGKTSNDLKFETTGEEQDPGQDPLAQKRQDLDSLKRQYEQTFGK